MARHGSSPRPQDLGGGRRDAAAARQAGRQQERAGQPGRQAARQPQAEALEHIGGTVAVRIGQVLARTAQQRKSRTGLSSTSVVSLVNWRTASGVE